MDQQTGIYTQHATHCNDVNTTAMGFRSPLFGGGSIFFFLLFLCLLAPAHVAACVLSTFAALAVADGLTVNDFAL